MVAEKPMDHASEYGAAGEAETTLQEEIEIAAAMGTPEQLRLIAKKIDHIDRKVDHVADEQTAMKNGAGEKRAKGQLTLVMIGLGILGTVVGVGLTFVQTSDAHLADRMAANERMTDKLIESIQSAIKRNGEIVDALAQSRWSDSQHDAYHNREVKPLQETVRRNEIALARIEQDLKALQAQKRTP